MDPWTHGPEVTIPLRAQVSSPIGARLPSGSCGRPARPVSPRLLSTPTATVRPGTCAWPTRPGRSTATVRPTPTCESTSSSTIARASRRRRGAPRLRVSCGKRRVRGRVPDAGLIFVGPTPDAIALMGSKTAAREAAIAAGVPVVPGTDRAAAGRRARRRRPAKCRRDRLPGDAQGRRRRRRKGHAAGPRRRVARRRLRAARSEAQSAFGDGDVYLERRLDAPAPHRDPVARRRHGTVIPFVERECSVQRRHQKVVEESPSPAVNRRSFARRSAEAAQRVARRSATPTPAPSSSCSTPTDGSTSSR